MPMPPLPPDFGGLFAAIVWLVVLGLVFLAALAFFDFLKAHTSTNTSTGVNQSSQSNSPDLNRTMSELLEEVRKLRSEIEELRRELRE